MRLSVLVFVLVWACTPTRPPQTPLDYGSVWDHSIDAWRDMFGVVDPHCLSALTRTQYGEAPADAVRALCGNARAIGCTFSATDRDGPHVVAIAAGMPPHESCDTMAHEFVHVLDACHLRPFGRPAGKHPPELFDTATHSLLIEVMARSLADCLRHYGP